MSDSILDAARRAGVTMAGVAASFEKLGDAARRAGALTVKMAIAALEFEIAALPRWRWLKRWWLNRRLARWRLLA